MNYFQLGEIKEVLKQNAKTEKKTSKDVEELAKNSKPEPDAEEKKEDIERERKKSLLGKLGRDIATPFKKEAETFLNLLTDNGMLAVGISAISALLSPEGPLTKGLIALSGIVGATVVAISAAIPAIAALGAAAAAKGAGKVVPAVVRKFAPARAGSGGLEEARKIVEQQRAAGVTKASQTERIRNLTPAQREAISSMNGYKLDAKNPIIRRSNGQLPALDEVESVLRNAGAAPRPSGGVLSGMKNAARGVGNVASKVAVPLTVALEGAAALSSVGNQIEEDRTGGKETSLMGVASGVLGSVAGGFASISDFGNNMTNAGINKVFGTDYRTDYDLAGQVKQGVLDGGEWLDNALGTGNVNSVMLNDGIVYAGNKVDDAVEALTTTTPGGMEDTMGYGNLTPDQISSTYGAPAEVKRQPSNTANLIREIQNNTELSGEEKTRQFEQLAKSLGTTLGGLFMMNVNDNSNYIGAPLTTVTD
jgi:hypothetical protein